MELILVIYSLVTLVYATLISAFIVGFFKVKKHQYDKNSTTKFSIIIPFRNEVKNLSNLLESILHLSYPKNSFEILFVDDFSDDNSINIIQDKFLKSDVDYQIISNEKKSNSPKKDAIETAISKSKYDVIVTTDADCLVPEFWLHCFNSLLNDSKSNMIVAPIRLIYNTSFVQKFQALEVLSLQTITTGAFGLQIPFLANGANLCYKKSDFLDVSGYEGNNHIASGDDIFYLKNL